MFIRKHLLKVALVLLACLVVFLGLQIGKNNSRNAKNTPTAALQQQNPDFARAEQYRAQGEYSLAQQSYQKALAQTSDSIQKTQITYNAALALEESGDYAGAIGAFKAIAADPSANALSRAYAVQEIGLTYGKYPQDVGAITAATFVGTPYGGFAQGADTALAYRKLFEYAASFYPLGSSEVRIAYWYASNIANNLKATTTPRAKSELLLAGQAILKTDADIRRTSGQTANATLIPGIYAREGMVFALLSSVGVVAPESAEQRFQKGVQFADDLGKYGLERYRYAQFLAASAGQKRDADIKNLLSAYTAAAGAKIYASASNFFRAARTSASLASDRKSLVQLARIAPDFKAYLISLGWKNIDFQ